MTRTSYKEKWAERYLLEAITIAEKKNIELPVEVLMEAGENIIKQPAPDPPEDGITFMEAERLFGINHSTISRWVQQGYLDILLETNRETYIDRIQLENLVGHYTENPGQGKFTLRKLFGKGHPRHDFKRKTQSN